MNLLFLGGAKNETVTMDYVSIYLLKINVNCFLSNLCITSTFHWHIINGIHIHGRGTYGYCLSSTQFLLQESFRQPRFWLRFHWLFERSFWNDPVFDVVRVCIMYRGVVLQCLYWLNCKLSVPHSRVSGTNSVFQGEVHTDDNNFVFFVRLI